MTYLWAVFTVGLHPPWALVRSRTELKPLFDQGYLSTRLTWLVWGLPFSSPLCLAPFEVSLPSWEPGQA